MNEQRLKEIRDEHGAYQRAIDAKVLLHGQFVGKMQFHGGVVALHDQRAELLTIIKSLQAENETLSRALVEAAIDHVKRGEEIEQRDKVIEKYETAIRRAYKRRGSSHPNVVEAMRILAEALENSGHE